MLLPNLKKGQIIIMDNASIHKSRKIREAIKKAGCHLVFQPPYSPDLNPIEHCWSWMKRKFRSLNLTPHSLEEIVKCAKLY
jgi:transposase